VWYEVSLTLVDITLEDLQPRSLEQVSHTSHMLVDPGDIDVRMTMVSCDSELQIGDPEIIGFRPDGLLISINLDSLEDLVGVRAHIIDILIPYQGKVGVEVHSDLTMRTTSSSTLEPTSDNDLVGGDRIGTRVEEHHLSQRSGILQGLGQDHEGRGALDFHDYHEILLNYAKIQGGNRSERII